MIDISQAVNTVMRRMKKASPGSGIMLLTYKKDRHVAITLTDSGRLMVEEHGFEEQKFEIEQKALKKTLKTLLKREFPRSRKVHIKSI